MAEVGGAFETQKTDIPLSVEVGGPPANGNKSKKGGVGKVYRGRRGRRGR